MARNNQKQLLVAGLATAALISLVLYYTYGKSDEKSKEKTTKLNDKDKTATKSRGLPSSKTPQKVKTKSDIPSDATTPLVSNTRDEKALHLQIEDLDKKGKALFKNKQYLEAAQAFTEALDLIETQGGTKGSSSLTRQVVTLTNNRSAMYEKGGLPDLALEDCRAILEMEVGHQKARTRRLRILESQKNYADALIEVCALQLRFMQENRDKLRMGIPVTPPVPQSKLEELIGVLLPAEVDKYFAINEKQDKGLPSDYTLLALLKSFSNFNSWMAKAAKDGTVAKLTQVLEAASTDAEKASAYMKRGRRQAYERKFDLAMRDFEAGYSLVKGNQEVQTAMVDDDLARLLEWTGMIKHWKYNLEGAEACYKQCSDLEPINADILVKRAGVKMDGGKHDESLALFETALGLDPNATDALLHRANLYMIQMNTTEARKDLERCLELRPDHTLARLRLASLLMASNDMAGAKAELDMAEQHDPSSSEVHSYRGEMCFTQNEMADAKMHFEKAIASEPGNPTPYVNAALTIMNTPPPSGMPPDIPGAIGLLEKAIEVDPQFHAAYAQLGQLRLSLATDLTVARDVIKLYDKGISRCRTKEELKEIVSMRLLTVAQVDAASALGMETFSMQ